MIQCYFDNILPEIYALYDEKDPRRLVIHADNAKPHIAKGVKNYMDHHNLRTPSHSPYSPDSARGNFFLFGHVKRALQQAEPQRSEELLDAAV
jgi:hypothetical protein